MEKKPKDEDLGEEARNPSADEDAETVEPVPLGEVDGGAFAPEEEASEATGELLKRLDEAEEKARENEDRYLRTVADLENFRRRAARDREDLRETALAGLIEDLLPAMDNLRLGLQAADNHPEAADVAAGFRMVADQLRKTLESYGLEEIDPSGAEFDPNLHDCVAHQPHAEQAEGLVIETVRPGFRLKKRLIRAASVVVSSGPPESGSGES